MENVGTRAEVLALPHATSILGKPAHPQSLDKYADSSYWSSAEQELIIERTAHSFEEFLGVLNNCSSLDHLGLARHTAACNQTLRTCLAEKNGGLLHEAILASCYNLAHALSKAAAMQLGTDEHALQKMTLPSILSQNLVAQPLAPLLRVVELCSSIKVARPGGTPVKDTSLKMRLGQQPGNMCIISLSYLCAALARFCEQGTTDDPAAKPRTNNTFVVVNLVSPASGPATHLHTFRQGYNMQKTAPDSDSQASLGLDCTPPSRGSSFMEVPARASRSFVSSCGSRDLPLPQPHLWGSPVSSITGTSPPTRSTQSSAGFAVARVPSPGRLRISCSHGSPSGSSRAGVTSSLSAAGTSSRHAHIEADPHSSRSFAAQEVGGFRTYACAAYQVEPDDSPRQTPSSADVATIMTVQPEQAPPGPSTSAGVDAYSVMIPPMALGHGISTASELKAFKDALKQKGLGAPGLDEQGQGVKARVPLHMPQRLLSKAVSWVRSHAARQPQEQHAHSQASSSDQRVSAGRLDLSKDLDFEQHSVQKLECSSVEWPGVSLLLLVSLAHAAALGIDVHTVVVFASKHSWASLQPASLWGFESRALGRAQAVILAAAGIAGPLGCICTCAILFWCKHRDTWAQVHTSQPTVEHTPRVLAICILVALLTPWLSTVLMPVLLLGVCLAGHRSTPLVAGLPITGLVTVKVFLQLALETLPSWSTAIWAYAGTRCVATSSDDQPCTSYPAERAAMLVVVCVGSVTVALTLWLLAAHYLRNTHRWRRMCIRSKEAEWQVSASKVVDFGPDDMQMVLNNPLCASNGSQLIPAGSVQPQSS